MSKRRRSTSGGLFPEDGRRRQPTLSEYKPEKVAENGRGGLRASILKLLTDSDIQAAVTDARTVQTVNGERQLVYPQGWPDITASVPVTGRAWGIEIKTEDGELRPSQEDKLLELEAAGWLITLARSVADVEAELKRQLDYLWAHRRNEYQRYLISLRRHRGDAAQRAFERERARRARATPNRPSSEHPDPDN